jgi:NitT/TauT family transport system substrate-binding protein
MPAALAARERAWPLVNIAQPFERRADADLPEGDRRQSPADFPDKTLGVWFFGNEYPFCLDGELGLKTDGSEGGVTVLKQASTSMRCLQKQAACISVMTYNEYWPGARRRDHSRPAGDLQVPRPGRGDAGRRALRD